MGVFNRISSVSMVCEASEQSLCSFNYSSQLFIPCWVVSCLIKGFNTDVFVINFFPQVSEQGNVVHACIHSSTFKVLLFCLQQFIDVCCTFCPIVQGFWEASSLSEPRSDVW